MELGVGLDYIEEMLHIARGGVEKYLNSKISSKPVYNNYNLAIIS